ncbi:MAG: hypothetical protein ACHQQS_08465 [Thermoanaerobaculales bacterium]
MGRTKQSRLAAVAVAALVAAPALTTLAFGYVLVAQAAAATAVVVVMLCGCVVSGGYRSIPKMDRPSLFALALYSAAALQGGVVALVRGNDATFMNGQLLSMILLPLGAVAAFGLWQRGEWRWFATGLLAVITTGGLIQLYRTIPIALTAPDGFRLLLPNTGTFAGIAPLGLFAAAALARREHRFSRLLAYLAAAVMLALVAGSGIRSQWLVLPFGVAAYAVLATGWARLFSRRVMVFVGPAVIVFVVGVGAATWWWLKPRPALIPAPSALASVRADTPLLLPLPGKHGEMVRIRGTLKCRSAGYVALIVLPHEPSTGAGAETTRQFGVSGEVASDIQVVLALQPGQTALVLKLLDPQNLGCAVSGIRVEELWPPALARLGDRVARLLNRPPDPSAGSAPEAFAGDASLAFRLREIRAIQSEFRRSGWPLQLFGHGLGATYSIDSLGYDSRGHVVRFGHPNYIHNFYLFLLFKLGLLGTIEVLAALALWVWVAARGAQQRLTDSADRHFFAAVAASWITYILWSAAAPEILDFRMAAIWGMLVATTASALRGTEGRPEGERSQTTVELAQRPG